VDVIRDDARRKRMADRRHPKHAARATRGRRASEVAR
jgi:hypothetical protein